MGSTYDDGTLTFHGSQGLAIAPTSGSGQAYLAFAWSGGFFLLSHTRTTLCWGHLFGGLESLPDSHVCPHVQLKPMRQHAQNLMSGPAAFLRSQNRVKSTRLHTPAINGPLERALTRLVVNGDFR